VLDVLVGVGSRADDSVSRGKLAWSHNRWGQCSEGSHNSEVRARLGTASVKYPPRIMSTLMVFYYN